jgi:hypothetical protein
VRTAKTATMTRWVSERLDVLADHATAVAVVGFLWIVAELGAILGLLIAYR